jgi:hypothetical protein
MPNCVEYNKNMPNVASDKPQKKEDGKCRPPLYDWERYSVTAF